MVQNTIAPHRRLTRKFVGIAMLFSLVRGEKEEPFAGGKVHAKVAVSDEKMCFISSANLTGHAMEKNMEAGVLIRGGSIPSNLHNRYPASCRRRARSAMRQPTLLPENAQKASLWVSTRAM